MAGGLLEFFHPKRSKKTNSVAEVQEAKADILSDLKDSLEGDESGEGGLDEETSSEEDVPLDPVAVKKAALPPSTAVAAAQQRLAEEEAAFQRRKTIKKSEKIKASDSQQDKLKKEQEEKEAKKARKAQEEEERGDKGLFDFLTFDKKKEAQPTEEERREKNRIDRAQANKKTDDEIKKFGKAIGAVGLAGKGDSGLAKSIGKALDAGNIGDDIASAAGSVATSIAGVASSLVDAFRAFRLYSKTKGAERSVHLKVAMAALGGAFGNLVNLTKGSLVVAEHSGALEAGSAVPILGIVAAVPTLLAEINDLRSAMTRLTKQQSVYFALEKQIKDGDASQATLFTMVSSFIARDTEAVGKGITKVTLDFTKIAGHGVTAGGITGPIGVAMIAVAGAGKLVLSGIGTVEDLTAANRANDRRKKLQPTLNASADWKSLAKEKPEAAGADAMNKALDLLAKAQKGSPEHAAALEALCTAANGVKQANAKSPKLVAFATQLVEKAQKEKADWADADEDDNEQGQPAQGGAQDAHQRNARKLIKQDPQVAAQVLLDQALRRGQARRPGLQGAEVVRHQGHAALQR